MKLLVATSNRGKQKEIAEALIPLNPHLELVNLQEAIKFNSLPHPDSPKENGNTYAQNALIKASFYFDYFKMPTLAEDSGLEVEALTNELGIHTRRWGAGPHANDEEWLTYFMKRMQTEKNRKARFISHICYIDNEGVHHFEGHCKGHISRTIDGPILKGIPLSSVFIPEGCTQVYSQLSNSKKNSLSHRGLAVSKLAQHLNPLQ